MTSTFHGIGDYSSGTSAVVASVIGLIYRVRFVHELDRTWASYIVEICLEISISNRTVTTTQNWFQYSFIESCVSIICNCMPTIPAISLLIISNSYFATLRRWPLPLFTSSSKSRSIQASFRRKVFAGNKDPGEHEPYFELVDNGKVYIGTRSATKTQI